MCYSDEQIKKFSKTRAMRNKWQEVGKRNGEGKEGGIEFIRLMR